MPKITADFKKQVKQLSRTELETVLLKFAGRDKQLWGHLYIHYINPTFGVEELLEQTQEGLVTIFEKPYRGKTETIRRIRCITASLKYVAEFAKIVKQPELEVELLLQVVEYQLSLPSKLGTHYQSYDNKVTRLIKKIIDLLDKKVHPDYHLEFAPRVNQALTYVRERVPYNTVLQKLPLHWSSEN